MVLVAAPDGAPGGARLPLRGARPPRLRRHRRAAGRRLLLRLPPRRRRRRAPRRPRSRQGVRGGARLGRDHRVVPVPVSAGPRDGAGEHKRGLHAPRLHPHRLWLRRRQAHRVLLPRLRPDLLHLSLPGARGCREGVLAGAREVHHEADPVQPLHLRRGRRRPGAAGERRGLAAAGVADGGRRGLLRVGVREDGLHRRHQLLPQHGPQLGAGGAVGGRQGDGADQVHRRRWRPDVPLRPHPGLHPQGRVQGRRAAAGGRRRHPRRRPLHPAGEGAGGQRPHLRLHHQVLKLVPFNVCECVI